MPTARCACFLAFVAFGHHPAFGQNIISTIAGSDKFFPVAGVRSDGLPLAPYGHLTTDAAGNLYFIDSGANRVLRLSAANVLTVVAGNGIRGFSGDGGPAVRASLYVPYSIAADSRGNLLIADRLNHRIRRVSADGMITTFAGDGRRGFRGDGGPALSASFNSPQGIAADAAGNVFVADTENARIRKIDTRGIVTTVAGGVEGEFIEIGLPATQSPLAPPRGLAIAPNGTLYFTMPDINLIAAVDPAGVLRHIAGTGDRGVTGDGGPATAATLGGADGLALDNAGNLYAADYGNGRVRRIDPAGVITTVAGSTTGFSGDGGPAVQARMNFVSGVALDSSGSMFISDNNNGRIRKVSGGVISSVAGSNSGHLLGDGGPARSAIFYYSRQAVADRSGNLYVLDTGNHRVRHVAQDGTITTYAGTGVSGFSGDGGPATSARLSTPFGIALDANGNLYIADTVNSRIRRVDPNGVITTIAGNGQYGFSGNNGPATQAVLGLPRAVAVDQDGSVFIAETATNTIRRVDRNGIITLVAGQPGVSGFGGDNGPAVRAALASPVGLSIDPFGNLLIADSGSATIRRISGGVIGTLAGSGQPGALRDNTRALGSPLGVPEGVVADRNGNLYIADSGHFRVRMVDASGTIGTIAGTGEDTFSGDGLPATQAALSPTGVSLDASGQLIIADGVNNRVRVLLSAVPTVEILPMQLSFSADAGGAPTVAQTIRLRGGVAGLAFTATASAPWIRIDETAGVLASDIRVWADPGSLPAGMHEETVVINTPGAAPASRSIPVRLVLAAGKPAELGIDKRSLTFSFVEGDPEATSRFSVLNLGGGSAQWIGQPNASARSWMSVSPANGTATASSPSNVVVTANPGRMSAGTYSGSIAVVSPTGGSETVPVIMTIAKPQPKLALTTSGLQFRVTSGGGALPRTVGIFNSGRGAMSWTAAVRILGGDTQWLRVNRDSGSTSAPLTDISEIEVSTDASGLAPGTYFGEVSIAAPEAAAGAQSVVVTLNVAPPGTPVAVDVHPSTLVFAGERGDSPGSRNAAVANPTGFPMSFVVSPSGRTGWVRFTPASATIAPGQSAQLTVQPVLAGLAPGIHEDTLALQFSDGSTQTVSVVAIVGTGGTSSSGVLASHTACSPKQWRLSTLTGQKQIDAVAGQAITSEVLFADDCSHGVSAGIVTGSITSASSVHGSVDFRHAGAGRWTGTWTPPRTLANSTVSLTVTGFASGAATASGVAGDQLLLTVRMLPAPPAPAARSSDVVNAASFAQSAPIAPGSLITIFGEEFIGGEGLVAPGAPLPTELGGTEVRLGDRPLPLLYAGGNQINAQVPFDVDGNVQHQLKIRRQQSLAIVDDITVADAEPAVFTANQSGTGQGTITNGVTGVVADERSPVRAGDVVSIYCTGLGLVSPAIRAGEQAPAAGPLSFTVNPVEVTIGDKPALVQFSGLAPGFTGLYQVNATVPADVSGDAVTVTVRAAGRESPPVTIAVR